jgi:hypothetical protein
MTEREQAERKLNLDPEELEIEELDTAGGGVTLQTNCTCTVTEPDPGGPA